MNQISLRFLPLRVWFLAMVVLLLATPLTAQFNGPADSAKDTVNAPHIITTDTAILFPPPHDVRIHASDTLRVTLYGFPDYMTSDRVTQEGYINPPLIEPVKVIDLTLKETERLIAIRLEEAGMYRKPQVRVEISDSPASVITVMGETHGTVTVPSGSKRLFEVLSSTGGLPATVSHVVSIDRPGLVQSINVDLGTDPEQSKYANIPLFIGDTVTTSRIGSIYLIGAWKQSGVFPLTNTAPLTMLQVLATSGGKLWEAKLEDIHLIRTVGTQRTMVTVNLEAVRNGRAPDPVLQADDIVFAPSVLWRAAIRSGGLTTGLGLVLTILSLRNF